MPPFRICPIYHNTNMWAGLVSGGQVKYEGVDERYEPDYIVRLMNGKTIILEIKGEEDDRDRAKYQAARRWVSAVNNWGRLGVWDFLVCRDPHNLPRQLTSV